MIGKNAQTENCIITAAIFGLMIFGIIAAAAIAAAV